MLAELDQRVLPPLAAAAGRLTRRVGSWWSELLAPGGWRRLPGVLPIAIACVLAAGVAAVPLAGARTGTSAGCLAADEPGSVVLGPGPNQPVVAYLRASRCRVAALGHTYPREATLALVDFRGYEPIRRLPALLGGTRLLAAWVRYRERGVPTPATEYPATSARRLADEVASARVEALDRERDLELQLAGGGRHHLPSGTRREVASLLRSARADVRGLVPGCRCIFAVVVRARPAALRRLLRRRRIRVVDPAPPYVPYPTLVTVPLLPEVHIRQRPLDGGPGGVTEQ